MINESIPTHVAIIMDGNGRWATKRGKKRSEGHLAGSKILKRLAIHAAKRGIKILSVFAFSTENFKRSEEEVTYLMDLLIKYFKKEIKTFQKYNIRVKISGRKDRLREDVLKAIDNVEDKIELIDEAKIKTLETSCYNIIDVAKTTYMES